ncbi:MAG: hypothetical protein ACRC3H_25635 [Lachnospiraceae bacterium]
MTWLEEMRDCIIRYVKHYKIQVTVGCVLAFMGVMLGAYFLTKDEAIQVTSDFVKLENIGYENESHNPLQQDQYEDVNSVVKKYYEGLTESSDFVDSYDDISVYTKLGRYEGTYIVFVKYQMNIPGIYTKAPGLETLYVYEDAKHSLCISTELNTEQQKELVEAVVVHNDVQALFTQVQEEYQEAIASDALLEEALQDLQNAYNKAEN